MFDNFFRLIKLNMVGVDIVYRLYFSYSYENKENQIGNQKKMKNRS